MTFSAELNKMREDFLWFSYFGKKKPDEASKAQIIDCTERAFRDLARTLKYTYNSSCKRSASAQPEKDYPESIDPESLKKAKNEFKRKAAKTINGFVNNTLLVETNDYDVDLIGTCNTLVKAAETVRIEQDPRKHLFVSNGFTFGHAQKWVNMTVKNMLIMGLWNDRINEQTLSLIHVPIDSFILEKANNLKCPYVENKGGTWKLSCSNGGPEPWSKISDSGVYLNFQKWLRDNIPQSEQPPILWESSAWIDAAAQ